MKMVIENPEERDEKEEVIEKLFKEECNKKIQEIESKCEKKIKEIESTLMKNSYHKIFE